MLELKRTSKRRHWDGAARFAIAGIWAVVKPAIAATPQGSQALVLNYGLEASLAYIDVLQKSPLSANTGPMLADDDGSTPTDTSQPRVLGLKRMRAELEWRAGASTSLKLVFRPDAVNRQMEMGAGAVPREFDGRSGDSGMKPLPTIRLLDAYQIRTSIGPKLSMGAGVWEGFAATSVAYPELLGFGLDVILPAKFGAVALEWQTGAPSLPTAAHPNPHLLPPELTVGVFYFLGDQDRGEAMMGHRGSYDRAATGMDPYQGAASTLTWRPVEDWTLGLLGGYFEAASGGNGYDSVFAQASVATSFVAGDHRHRFSLEARMERDHGRGTVAAQNLYSGSGKLAWGMSQDTYGLFGVRIGRGSRWADFATGRSTTVGLDGYQIEGGASTLLGTSLSLQFLLSREFRTMTNAGQKLGGFRDRDGDKTWIHRIGLELAYVLNSNS